MDGYVLIVDDSEDARIILSQLLGGMQMRYIVASSGQEATAFVAQHKPDMILLDLMMPGMSGFDVFSRLQSSLNTRHIPVVVVTSLPRDQINMLRLPGVSAVVQKGDLGTVIALIRKLTGSSTVSGHRHLPALN